MLAYESYFTERRIVAKLCRIRVADARREGRKMMDARLSGANAAGVKGEANQFLPPRRVWNRFRPRRPGRARPTGLELAAAIARHAVRELERGEYSWARDLRDLIESIRCEALHWDEATPLTHTQVFAIPKGRPGNGQPYRVIVGYGLRERLLSSCAAAYLRDLIDGQLPDSVLSARSAGHRTPAPNHHDAVERIQRFREGAGELPIYCAESDIRSFFDTVDHGVLVREAERLLHGCGQVVDERIHRVIRSLLRGYDLLGSEIPAARKSLAAQGVRFPKLPDPVGALAAGWIAAPLTGIGIPQGNALSGVLANIVLARADQAVVDVLETAGGHGLYLRYVDDTIFAHTERAVCAAALAAYQAELEDLLLPAHPPVLVDRYRRTFWSDKSKAPYLWSGDGEIASVPWLAFVGYQIQDDSVVRPRPGSIARHKQKMRDVFALHIAALERLIVTRQAIPTPEALAWRLEGRLVAMGVGRPLPAAAGTDRNGSSWLAGFAALGGQRVDTEGLRELDRERGRLVRQFRTHVEGRLRGLPPMVADAQGPRRTQPRFWLGFHGRPFSYAELAPIEPSIDGRSGANQRTECRDEPGVDDGAADAAVPDV